MRMGADHGFVHRHPNDCRIMETRCKAFELLENAWTSSMFIAPPEPPHSAGAKVSKLIHCKVVK